MNDVLAMCGDLREIRIAKGESLIEEGIRTDRLYVLRSGAFEVVRNKVPRHRDQRGGAFLGEISAVLGSAPTAERGGHGGQRGSRAGRCVRLGGKTRPELMYAIAQVLARRLWAVTAYLVDIKRQYAGTDTHLTLMDQVLANLSSMQPATIKPGSERDDVPDY
jgi:CRP-like cAMP-binding protein